MIGLGLIGLITVQILKANGCHVIGFDYDVSKVELARSWGVDAFKSDEIDTVKTVESITLGIGADAVLITASTKSNDLISESARMSRKRGRIVLVGVVGLNIQRSEMYEKELSFQVSCSYGPGRYDSNFENKGYDYPIGFVRWTEQRNFQAILEAIKSKSIKVENLITDRIKLKNYRTIYYNMSKRKSIASIIDYEVEDFKIDRDIIISDNKFYSSKGVLGIIGAGNFTSNMIIPILYNLKVNMKYIASSKGLSGTTLAKKYNISRSTTDYKIILEDKDVNAVIITTRHNEHALQVNEALEANKHVFVEKPLALQLKS